jgi:RNA polymerase sigma-70 factor (ECF subfamily)
MLMTQTTPAGSRRQDQQVQLFRSAAAEVRPEFQEETWQAFWRTAVLGRDANQAAHELGMSLGAVYVARSRVLAKLKAKVSALSRRAPFLALAGSRGD